MNTPCAYHIYSICLQINLTVEPDIEAEIRASKNVVTITKQQIGSQRLFVVSVKGTVLLKSLRRSVSCRHLVLLFVGVYAPFY